MVRCIAQNTEKQLNPIKFNNVTKQNTPSGKPSKLLKILQINADRSRASHDMVYAAAMRNEVDIVVASEPNKKMVSGNRWMTDHSSDVAIL